MDTNDDYRILAMNRKQAKREMFGNGHKFDNLNGGRMKEEYVKEIHEAQQDSRNHTVQMSDGFKNWLSDRFHNQERERQEDIQNVKERMFPKHGELSEIDKAMHEYGEKRNYHVRKYEQKERFSNSLFSDIDRRREDIENSRHPMDIAMRNRLDERKRAQ